MSDYRPTLAITLGEPSGIGPEVIVKALADPVLRQRAKYVIYGMNELLAYAADLAEFDVFWWRDPYQGRLRSYPHDVVVVDYDSYNFLGTDIRGPSKMGGEASMRFCLDAIDAAMNGLVDGIVTAPIAKESWKLAGYGYPGHTELFASRTQAKRHAMMFAGGPLKVVLCTVHVPLNGLWGKLNIGAVFHPIELIHQAMVEWFDTPNPRIAVAGLNPHASENGQFGDEEERIITPAIQMAREQGIDATGPYPPDTVFLAAKDGKYDAVVAMYHDQGLIPVKLLAFDRAVNVTIGLPIIRTSPDHGTAFDIVGKNRANPGSMRAAIELAIEMAVKKHDRLKSHPPTPMFGDGASSGAGNE
ncbi:4-hydroxythreonine-4-phosphate dehydrogenase PdxA [Humisphaera borealis]|uniref:4-hydroxythreonine-4-phosphate dehydrogenase PdxA n=1 Tax=Humisphaera borealis TaxID=2807512 RepID=A0A7M2WUZ8_9BACT|nr:4-hydroxythreonine-4-phosphate dehydrogenase PdxA [Humisphaera borealis]QOV89387.1 4-hydroxythreonine-4-phosphate dehydrogenase PdxA [Humisphaera borealis]